MWTDSMMGIAVRLLGALTVVGLVAVGIGCSDLAVDTPEDYYHPANWTEPGGENFHGQYVFDSPSELDKCTSCHGATFEGELKAPACSTCHESYPHKDGWVEAEGGSHGTFARANPDGVESCQSCHGSEYEGGAEAPACSTCHESYPHKADWLVRSSDDFHGEALLEAEDGPESCAPCHGIDYSGGTSGVACSTCHEIYPHEIGFGGEAAAAHPAYMRDEAAWDLSTCTSCHGSSYDGDGWASKSCLTCHAGEEGPEACNTCHGGSEAGMPPPDLYGRTDTSLKGVGAHSSHAMLGDGTDTCANCHAVPDSYDADGHIDGNPPRAEIVFGGISALAGASPTYDAATGTCGTTYCHGAWSFPREGSPFPFGYTADFMTGNSAEVVWTSVGTGQAVCGSCHGLPPTEHWDRTQCESCHPRGPDGEFPDPSTHVDGRIDAIGESRSAE